MTEKGASGVSRCSVGTAWIMRLPASPGQATFTVSYRQLSNGKDLIKELIKGGLGGG